MKKELLKKLKLGIISLSAIALLAACGSDSIEELPIEGEPPVEEPADDEGAPAGGVSEDEEEAN